MNARAEDMGLPRAHSFSWSRLLSRLRLLHGSKIDLSTEDGQQLSRDVSTLLSAMTFGPVSGRLVDMQKYCAYLLAHRFLKRCPY